MWLRSQLANFSQFWFKFCHLWDQCKSSEKMLPCMGGRGLYYWGTAMQMLKLQEVSAHFSQFRVGPVSSLVKGAFCREWLWKGCNSFIMDFRDMGPFENLSYTHVNMCFYLSDPKINRFVPLWYFCVLRHMYDHSSINISVKIYYDYINYDYNYDYINYDYINILWKWKIPRKYTDNMWRNKCRASGGENFRDCF